jgi:hypothetical protein
MRSMVTAFFGIFFCYQPLYAQLVAKPATELEALLKQIIPDEKKVPVLLQLTLYYYFEQNATEEIGAAGGDIVRTSGATQYHATVTGLTSEHFSNLLNPTIRNPIK